jgi:hypothetical protein
MTPFEVHGIRLKLRDLAARHAAPTTRGHVLRADFERGFFGGGLRTLRPQNETTRGDSGSDPSRVALLSLDCPVERAALVPRKMNSFVRRS